MSIIHGDDNPPECPVHKEPHPPVLCRTDHAWHNVTCKPKPKEQAATIPYGTHSLPREFWTKPCPPSCTRRAHRHGPQRVESAIEREERAA